MQLYTLPELNYLRLRFHLKALHDCDLPAWKGSLLRGAFGHALRRSACTMNPGQPPPFLKGIDTSPYSLCPSPQYENLKSSNTFSLQFIHIYFAYSFIACVESMLNKT
jgi:hypothetical protein